MQQSGSTGLALSPGESTIPSTLGHVALTPELEAYYEQFFVLGEGFTRDAMRVRAVDELEAVGLRE
jgi:hypothetical protein